MKSKKALKMGPVEHEQDIIVPALIILLALWFLAQSPIKPVKNEPETDRASISEEVALNANSPAEKTHWFAQTIKNRRETN